MRAKPKNEPLADRRRLLPQTSGARQAPPLGFPGGLLPFQVVIGGGPANLPPFPGAPGGIAMEDDDFVDVPSPREPPTRRRRTS